MLDEPPAGLADCPPPERSRRRRTVLRTAKRGIVLILCLALGSQVISIFMEARDAARRAVCKAYMNQLSTALTMYATDHDARMPPAGRWCDALYPYVKNLEMFRCPGRPSLPGGFAFNRLLSTRPLEEFNSGTLTPAIFESSIGTLNASDELQSFITPHGKPGWILYSTGWIQRVPDAPPATAGIRKPQPAKRSKTK